VKRVSLYALHVRMNYASASTSSCLYMHGVAVAIQLCTDGCDVVLLSNRLFLFSGIILL
jgi:hypothetical protein